MFLSIEIAGNLLSLLELEFYLKWEGKNVGKYGFKLDYSPVLRFNRRVVMY